MAPQVFARADADAVAFFGTNGWVMTRTLDAEGADRLRGWVDEIDRKSTRLNSSHT